MRPRVLIAYDGSSSAKTALRVAAGLFPRAQALIATAPQDVSVYVPLAGPGAMAATPDLLRSLVDEAARLAAETAGEAVELAGELGLQAEAATVPAFHPVAAALLDTAHELEADVLVCGTRGRGRFARALLGSTSSRLLHDTDLPLLVVPEGGGANDGSVVIAYDGSETAKRAIGVVGRTLGGRSVVIVHAYDHGFDRTLLHRALGSRPIEEIRLLIDELQGTMRAKAVEVTEEGVAAAREAGLEATGDTVPADGSAWRAVAWAARKHGASLVVVGSRGLGTARSVLLGSVSSGLVQNAELPTLVVPARR